MSRIVESLYQKYGLDEKDYENNLEESSKLFEQVINDSSYKDPIRFKISISSDTEENCAEVFNRIFTIHHIRPEILVDNQDGTGEICFPGKQDLIDFIKQCLYEGTNTPNAYNLSIE